MLFEIREAQECFVPWKGLTMLGTSRAEGVIEQVTEKTGGGQNHKDLSAAMGLDSGLAAGC